MSRALVVLAVAVLLTSACARPAQTADPTPTSSTTSAGGATTVEPSPSASADACDPSFMLPAVKAALHSDDGPTIASVTIRECRDGYARVGAVPGPAQTPGAVYETEQVFLRRQGETWEVVDYGSGIDCGDTELSQDLVVACEALRLR